MASESMREKIARRMAADTEALFMQAVTDSAAPEPEPTPTAEAMMQKIKEAVATLGPPPPVFVESEWLTDTTEDWSNVRSPGRAARRRKQGHRQNIVVTVTPKPDAYRIGEKIFVHPVTLAKARAAKDGA